MNAADSLPAEQKNSMLTSALNYIGKQTETKNVANRRCGIKYKTTNWNEKGRVETEEGVRVCE